MPCDCEIFNFPVYEKTLDVLREAIWQLDPGELLPATCSLVNLAIEASERGDDTDFYDRTKAAYLALKRVPLEGAVSNLIQIEGSRWSCSLSVAVRTIVL